MLYDNKVLKLLPEYTDQPNLFYKRRPYKVYSGECSQLNAKNILSHNELHYICLFCKDEQGLDNDCLNILLKP